MTRWKNEGRLCIIDGCKKPMRARLELHAHALNLITDTISKERQ